MGRIDMGRVFDGNLDRVESPTLELFEKFRAFVREWGGKEESIDSDAHTKLRLGNH
jgi:hypothetical protein